MRVCLILEGCYPYIRGGVSAWAHDYILSNPQIEFVLWTIHAARKYTEEALYRLPDNVAECREVFLEDAEKPAGHAQRNNENIAACVDCLRQAPPLYTHPSHIWINPDESS